MREHSTLSSIPSKTKAQKPNVLSIGVKQWLSLLGAMILIITIGYSQTYTFTNCGGTGRIGPTQTQVNAAYTGTSLDGLVTSSNGIQKWVVPFGGMYKITALGAQGGGANGGLGASMEGDFLLSPGDTLYILVGQQGTTQVNEPNAVGGGGGSFVVRGPATVVGDILVIAGGGGGSASNAYPSRHASAGTTGNNGIIDAGVSNPDGAGGTSGNGGNKSVTGCSLDRGAGGGGFLTNGGSICQTAGRADGGASFINGGNGGSNNDAGTVGSFGGGGAVWSTGFRGSGGGGGYSGGGGGQINTISPNHSGGGGGSYNTGINQVNTAGVNIGHGMIIIAALSTGATNDIGAISIDEPTVYCAGTHNVVTTIANFGVNQVTSATVNWTINALPQPAYSFSGVIDTVGGINPTSAQITLGSFAFTSASFDIKVWTSMPNGMADTVNMNDTTSKTVQSSLPAPGNLTADTVDAQTATISWTGGATNTWLYLNLPTGTPPTGVGTSVTTDSVVLMGLIPSTRYDFYVREVCPTGDTSLWAGPITYITLCLGGTVDSSMGATRCGPGPVVLQAFADTIFSINWYDAALGGNRIGVGGSVTTPSISATTDFYAAAGSSGAGTDSLNHLLTQGTTTGVYHHMFLIEAAADMTVNSIGLKCNMGIGILTSWHIYYRADNYQLVPGGNTSSAGWTLLSTVTGVPSQGANAFTEIGNNLGLQVPNGSTYSLYIAPAASETHQYFTAAMGTVTASNADLTIRAGNRGSTLFNCTSSGGQAVVNIKYSKGCEGPRVPVTATVIPTPTVNIGNDTFYCEGGSINLTLDAANPGHTYQWSTGASSQSINIDTAGVYTVTVTAPNTCETVDQITVLRHPKPVVDIGSDTSICEGTPTFFILNAGNPGASYMWSTGSQGASTIVTQPGTYSVTVTSSLGCKTSDTMTITEVPAPTVILRDTIVCEGELIVLDAGNPGSTYLWSNQSTTQTLTVTATGLYQVTVTNQTGCSANDVAVITIHPNPVVDLGNDTSTYVGAQVTLDAGNPGATYLWNTGATTRTITVSAHGTYSVTVTDANGCEGTATFINEPNSIHTVDGLGKWSVFPNPTDSDTHIRLDLSRGGQVAIELYDPSGRRVWEQNFSNATGTETISIPMQGLAQGMYLLRVRLDGQLIGTSAVGKL